MAFDRNFLRNCFMPRTRGVGNTRNSPSLLSNWSRDCHASPLRIYFRRPGTGENTEASKEKMKTGRPTNLNLFSFKWPVTALVSISHRISGILLFPAIALLLYLLDLSLASEDGFRQAAEILASPAASFITWLTLAALIFHLIAGCRHLLMDIGIGETWRAARSAAIAVFALAGAGAILAGLWIW